MKMEKFVDVLKSIPGVTPYYRGSIPQGTSLPFVTWYVSQSDNFAADNSVYRKQYDVIVSLYSAYKNFDLEAAIEKLLNDNNIYWDSDEAMIGDEATVCTIYTLTLPLE